MYYQFPLDIRFIEYVHFSKVIDHSSNKCMSTEVILYLLDLPMNRILFIDIHRRVCVK